ncbi:MAG TPA: NAD(P)-dependent oxidoreductase [Beijerinckiaceae bacterium]|jgi:3-hydroxyisobutyrate dehydrogenase-like beta-hydroxyacid dehydrogenase
MKGVVGVVGLGIMGGAIARNLASAGWRVIGFDIDAARRAELAGAGVTVAADVAALAREAPVILTSLPSAAALQDIAGQLAAAKVGRRIVVETSTLALDDKLKAEAALAAAGHVVLDCPLSGTGAQAKVKDLVVYASGDSPSIAQLQPLFADFARQAHDLGAFGNGSRMKFVANLLVAIHNVASAEAMVLGIKAGLDPHQLVKLVGAGVGTSRVFDLRAPMMADNVYEPATMKVSVWQKDMAVIGRFAADLGCPTPLFSATEPIYAAAMEGGHAAHDTAAVCAVLETMAGIKRGKTA